MYLFFKHNKKYVPTLNNQLLHRKKKLKQEFQNIVDSHKI